MECPKPVIETKQSIKNGKFPIKVVVNGLAPKENITRVLDNIKAQYQVTAGSDETEFLISYAVVDNQEEDTEVCFTKNVKEKVFLFKGDFIGADEVLGKKLARGFLKTIQDLESKPKKIIFINSGVKLTTSDEAELNQALENLENNGIEIYSCGICLEYFGLSEQLKVGKIGNALDTLDSLIKYDTVAL